MGVDVFARALSVDCTVCTARIDILLIGVLLRSTGDAARGAMENGLFTGLFIQ